jgi:hypothetical protein
VRIPTFRPRRKDLENRFEIVLQRYRKNTKPQQVSSLKTLIKSNKLTDIWSDLNVNVQQFTWRRKDKSQASRIELKFDILVPVK